MAESDSGDDEHDGRPDGRWDRMSWVRRAARRRRGAAALLLATPPAAPRPRARSQAQTVTIVGQNSTEADILTQLYKRLLDRDGYRTRVEDLGARDLYLGPLEKGRVQLAADYLARSPTTSTGGSTARSATPVASPDVAATLAQLTTPGRGVRHHAVAPGPGRGRQGVRRHEGVRASSTTSRTLSDLGRLGRPVALAAETTCAERHDCGPGPAARLRHRALQDPAARTGAR